MSIATMTIGELRKQIANKVVNDEILPSSMVSEVTVAIHAAYQDLIRESHGEAYLSSACSPITLVAGQSDYWLDDDVFHVVDNSFRYQDTPYWFVPLVDPRELDQWRSAVPTITDMPRVAAMNGSSPVTAKLGVTFWPTPSGAADGKAVTYRKIARLPSLWDADDDVQLDRRFPPEWFHALIAGALTWMPQYLSESDKVVWERKWAEYIRAARRYAWPVRGDHEQHERYQPQGGALLRHGRGPIVNWPMSR